MESPEFGGDFRPERLDLVLAVITAIGLPLTAGYLYSETGALLPLIVYYGVFCVGIVKWRKGTLDYRIPTEFWNLVFLFLLAVEVIRLFIATEIYEPVQRYRFYGFLLTALVWVPVNSLMEQISWLYVFDSFANYFQDKPKKYLGWGLGVILYVVLIGLIHALFWGKFLFSSSDLYPLSQIYFVGQIGIAIGYIYLYRRTESMLQVAIIHFIIDFSAVVLTRYSILPYL
ncbi:MAG: hypothetical protein ABEK59_06625 [Halobacteria archaeon]